MTKGSSRKRTLKVFSPTSVNSPESSPPTDSESSSSTDTKDKALSMSFETLLDDLDQPEKPISSPSTDQIEVELEEELEEESESDPPSPNPSTEQYHLLMIPPEGSVLCESYSTPQEILAAIDRHSEGPLALDEIDQWGVRVFYGRELELLGDIRSGRLGLRDGDRVHRPEAVSGDQLRKLAPGSFVPEDIGAQANEPAVDKTTDMFGGFTGGDDRLF